MVRCTCENIQHKGKDCANKPTKVCDTCNYSFCGSCAKNHHGHISHTPTFSKL